MSRIVRFEVGRFDYDLAGEFKFFKTSVRPSIVVRLTDENGVQGWGQSVPVETWTYETAETVETTLRHYLAPDRLGFIDTVGDEAIKRLRHCSHRADFAFQLPLLLDRSLAHVAAAGGIVTAQDEEFAYLREREAAMLCLLDEAQTPGGILVVEPVSRRALARRFDQSLPFVIA
jgi:hypothetical protein